jgi:protein gp37
MTKIEWAATRHEDGTVTPGKTWNPLSGCTRASSGCDSCYAATMTLRLAAMGQEKYQGLAVRLPSGRAAFNGTIKLDEDALSKPFSWKKPTTVFVNSMSDLFHKDVPESFIERVFDVMAATPQHTYQILTKRPERMAQFTQRWWSNHLSGMPDNIWCGTSVENQHTACERIPHLLCVMASVRFLSCEPLLGPIDLSPWLWFGVADRAPAGDLHWVIAGAESGHGARPADVQWFRDLRDQCQAAGVRFFLKQFCVNGRKVPLPELDGQQWTEMPEVSR